MILEKSLYLYAAKVLENIYIFPTKTTQATGLVLWSA